MSEHNDDNVVLQSGSTPSLGERLQEARQAKKYSVAEVATQLRLTKDIVIALETQQWEKLHGRTYARGYFASYVKYLGLPFDEMLAVFNLEYSVSEPSLNLYARGGEVVQSKATLWFSLIIGVALALTIWLAFQQWQLKQAELQAESATVEQFDDNFSSLEAESFLSTQLENDETSSLATEETPAISTDTMDDILATEILATEAGRAEEVESQLVVPESGTREQKIELSFNDECWVEITNSRSEVLISKVMHANESLTFESEAPLNILLGRASAVDILFNNEAVDLTPYIQGDVARLTLGVES